MLKGGFHKLVKEHGLDRHIQLEGYPPKTFVIFKNEKGEDDLLLKSVIQQEMIRRGFLYAGYHVISYSHSQNEIDKDIRILEKWKLEFETILQLGCCSGSLLAAIKEKFGGRLFVGIEPSQEAVQFGMEKYSGIKLYQGTIAKNPLRNVFDLVIVQFVLHWVDRSTLFKSICEIDGFVRDGGFLIIGDFDPNCPSKKHYHHLPDRNCWTFK